MIGPMRAVFKVFAVLSVLTCTWAGAAPLPKSVLQALKAAGVPPAGVAAVVQEAGASRPSISVNPQASINPASVMKLVTTYAALELLGPAYRWKTEAYLDGDHLVLRGTGDPKLNHESFWMLLRGLRGRGLREIRGDIVLDRSHFAPAPDLPFDGEAFRPYNVPPDALLVNFKSLRFQFAPENGGVRIYVEPQLPGFQMVNALRLGEGACPDGGRAFRDVIQASFQSLPPRAVFTGVYPAICGEREMNVALHAPNEYVAAMLRQLWTEMGGSWRGAVREGTTPPGARLVLTHESDSLAQIVRDINKFSNNVMARQLYLTLAAEMAGPPATAENARVVVRQWLVSKKIAAPELVLENGSGLSRLERASAATLTAVMQAAWKSAVMPEFIASLPVVAFDGTMRKRLLGERIAGNAHVKTGLLNDARSMAGYVLDRRGRRHSVVMIVNHPNAPQADAAFDALLTWVYEGSTGRGRATSLPREP
jgi:D-alanyl-D-alanine carboxypeptidase/D-alanyl-D-alanine-endopeptidase (penicillin-binding protein 4)